MELRQIDLGLVEILDRVREEPTAPDGAVPFQSMCRAASSARVGGSGRKESADRRYDL